MVSSYESTKNAKKKIIFFIHVALYQQNLDDENTLEAFRLDVATFRKTRHENLVNIEDIQDSNLLLRMYSL